MEQQQNYSVSGTLGRRSHSAATCGFINFITRQGHVTAGVQSQSAAAHAQLKTVQLAESALYCLATHSLVTCTLFPGKWLLLYYGHKQLVILNVNYILKY